MGRFAPLIELPTAVTIAKYPEDIKVRFKIQILNEEYKIIIFLFEAEGIVSVLIFQEQILCRDSNSCTKKITLMQYEPMSRKMQAQTICQIMTFLQITQKQ